MDSVLKKQVDDAHRDIQRLTNRYEGDEGYLTRQMLRDIGRTIDPLHHGLHGRAGL